MNDIMRWVNLVATLIGLGKTTFDEVKALIVTHDGTTDAETQAADDVALTQLRLVIAEQRAKALAEASRNG